MPTPLLIAHRLPGSAAECSRVMQDGAGGFELDVQLRGDTVVVTHYLPFLQIPSWWEHDGLRFRWGGGVIQDPELLEAIARVPAAARIVLDPKEQRAGRRDRLARAIAATVTSAALETARLVATAHDPRDLQSYRAAGIATWRTVGTEQQLREILHAGPVADAGLAVRHTLLNAGNIAPLQERAGTVAAWTVNDVSRARELAAGGVDVITTDSAAVMRALRAG